MGFHVLHIRKGVRQCSGEEKERKEREHAWERKGTPLETRKF